MPTLLSPQVFVQEVDATVYNVRSVGPIGAIVLRNSYKGREKDTILVSSENEIVTKFGAPNTACYKDMLSSIAFLKDSNNLYCTRVLPASATFAGTMATSGTSATFTEFDFSTAPILSSLGSNIEDPDLYPESVHAVTMTDEVMYVICKDRGHCGNYLRIAVCDKTAHDQIRQKKHDYTGWDTYAAIYGVDTPLETNKEILIVVQECGQGKDKTSEGNWSTVEWWNVSTNEMKMDDLGQNMYIESVVNTGSQYIRIAFNDIYNDTDIINFSTSEWQYLDGGRINDTSLISTTAGDPDTLTSEQIIAGYSLYANSESTDTDVLIDGDKPGDVKTYLVALAETRKDCMAIIDCLYEDVVNQSGLEESNLREWIINWQNTNPQIKSSYGAIYANWLDVYDKYSSKYRWVPASGYVAAVFAKCQREAEYWSTPAGFTRAVLGGVRRLAWNPNLSERDGIYKYGLNPIVSFSGQGKVIYGHKTMLDKYSAFSRINVRRLFISIENDIADKARKYLFEPNNTYYRGLLVSDVTTVLDYAKAHNGIDAYRVICDDTNNTEDRVVRGEMWADIFVKPVFATDYILITFIATKSSADFTESIVTTVTA
jgi:phage tail sheath protein FI